MGMTTSSLETGPDPQPPINLFNADSVSPGLEVLQDLLSPNITSNPERWIWVTYQREGMHAYPEAATDPALTSVSFLAHRHRHIFHFKVWITVKHDNRDVEFIMFKRELQDLYSSGTLEFDDKSCEMLAHDLYKYISTTYPGRKYKIEVSEDQENGCLIEWSN